MLFQNLKELDKLTHLKQVTGILECNAKRKEYKFQTWVGNLNIIATSAWKYPIECALYQTLKCKVNFGPITVSGTKFTRSGFQKSTKELRHIKTINSSKISPRNVQFLFLLLKQDVFCLSCLFRGMTCFWVLWPCNLDGCIHIK